MALDLRFLYVIMAGFAAASICGDWLALGVLPRPRIISLGSAALSLPAEPQGFPPADIAAILERNLFDAVLEDPKKPQRPLEESLKDLPLALVGTISSDDPKAGLAMISLTTGTGVKGGMAKGGGRVDSFQPGEEVLPGVFLDQVFREEAILRKGDRVARLRVVKKRQSRERRRASKPIRAPSPPPVTSASKEGPHVYVEEGLEVRNGKVNTTGTFVDDLVNHRLGEVIQQVLAKPKMADGGIVGFELTRIKPNSIFAKLGLQEGDVVTEANGVPLTDVGGALATMRSLKQAEQVEFRILRGGVAIPLEINVSR